MILKMSANEKTPHTNHFHWYAASLCWLTQSYFSVSAKNSPVASTAAYRDWKSSSLNTLKV